MSVCPSFLPSPSSSGLQLQALMAVFPTASSGSECSPPDLHRKLRIKVFHIGPQPRALDQSVLSHDEKESLKIYQIECQKGCQKICQKDRQNRCRIECQIECQSICQIESQIEGQNAILPDGMSEDMSEAMSG